MLIHGLSDDNVVVAHTLRFSAALLAAGREHTVLPITGATHMANDEAVAENLLLLELAFIRRAFAGMSQRLRVRGRRSWRSQPPQGRRRGAAAASCVRA